MCLLFFFYVNGDFVERSFELQILSDAQSLFFGAVQEEAWIDVIFQASMLNFGSS